MHSFVTGSNDSSFLISAKPYRATSSYAEARRAVARASGHLLVDTEMFRLGKGLRPYEQEYSRRIVFKRIGRLPRFLRGLAATIIVDGV